MDQRVFVNGGDTAKITTADKSRISSTTCSMNLRSPTDDEIALTLALSHRNGRGDWLAFSYPRPLFAGEGRVRVPCRYPSRLSKYRQSNCNRHRLQRFLEKFNLV